MKIISYLVNHPVVSAPLVRLHRLRRIADVAATVSWRLFQLVVKNGVQLIMDYSARRREWSDIGAIRGCGLEATDRTRHPRSRRLHGDQTRPPTPNAYNTGAVPGRRGLYVCNKGQACCRYRPTERSFAIRLSARLADSPKPRRALTHARRTYVVVACRQLAERRLFRRPRSTRRLRSQLRRVA